MTARELFPPSPTAPPGFTEASKAYGRHAWLALAGLLVFAGIYLGLVGYLAWIIYRLLIRSILYGGNIPAAFFLSLPALFFLAFLVSGWFVIKRGKPKGLVELKPEDEPKLFAFLAQLSEETRAPRPHKVFVSSSVNASVFYDISFWNFIFPSKKNLVLGLGLVNLLSLDELKAVVAHEYGHFAQRTMAVGRWVYIAQQAAGHVIASRTIFDKVLLGVSNIDIRIAWIGWIMRVFVWAFRAVLDTAFRVVVLTDRALGREMEFQADRVAVSVSGSDSLVHALHRLGPADEAWEEALNFAVSELSRGRPVEDLLLLQSEALQHMRRILDQPDFGATPRRPSYAASHRVFQDALAHPPRMWMTHPLNREREDNAKAVYLPSALDAREAWLLFRDPAALRRTVTEQTFEIVKQGEVKPAEGTQIERFAKRFSRLSLDPKYRGVYLGRLIAAHDGAAAAMHGAKCTLDRDGVLAAIDALYPPSLRAELTSYRERREEEKMLQGLADGVLAAPGGIIRYGGKEIRKNQLRGVIELARDERLGVERRLLEHDRACRSAHARAAELTGNGWPEYLQGLIELLHYATHAARNVADAHGKVEHVLQIVLADGRVSKSERAQVLTAANELHRALIAVWDRIKEVKLPSTVQTMVDEADAFDVFKEPLGLPMAREEILSEWLSAMGGWTEGAGFAMRTLANSALEALLEGEAKVAAALRDGVELEAAPERAVVPKRYETCVIGAERERQKKLDWWDRFQTADGVVPGTLRAAVACSLLLPVMFLGGRVGSTTVHIVNGLPVPVRVKIEQQEKHLAGYTTAVMELGALEHAHVDTRLRDGRPIEAFDTVIGGGFVEVAYNVAQATSLVQLTAVYGDNSYHVPPRPLGAPRWMDSPQDHRFVEPPSSVQVKAGQTETRTVLRATQDVVPEGQLSLVSDPEQRKAMIRAHLRYDRPQDPHLGQWLDHLDEVPDARAILEQRLAEASDKVVFERAIQDLLQDAERDARCAAASDASTRAPGDADALYLSMRCRPSDQSAPWIEAVEKHPTHPWISYAAAPELARVDRLKDALAAYEVAYGSDRTAAVREAVALEYWRVARAGKVAGVEAVLPVALSREPALSFMSSLERSGTRDDSALTKAYRGLARGDFGAALENGASTRPDDRSRLFVLVGASEGATPALVTAALAVPIQELDLYAACMLAALQLREAPTDRATADAKPSLASAPAAERVRVCDGALEVLRAPNPKSLEAYAEQQILSVRGISYAMGVIALGARAPDAWRAKARTLLFPSDRPYFRDPT